MVAKLKKTRVAIVGGGVGGISAAYNIWKQVGYKCHVEIFQSDSSLEGTAKRIQSTKLDCSIEVRPEVFCSASQPEFSTFTKELGVHTGSGYRAVYVEGADHVLGGVSLWVCLLTSIISAPIKTAKFVWTLLKFFGCAWNFVQEKKSRNSEITLKQFAKRSSLSKKIVNGYLEPLANAVFPYGTEKTMEMEAYPVLRHMVDHHLLSFSGLTWRSIASSVLIDCFLDKCKPEIHLNTSVHQVIQNENGKWTLNESPIEYDAIVFSLSNFLKHVTMRTYIPEAKFLMDAAKSVQYEEEIIYIHDDQRVMPEDRHDWGSAVVRNGITTYWENVRQHIAADKHVFSTVVTKDSNSRMVTSRKHWVVDPISRLRPCYNAHNKRIAQKIHRLSGSAGLHICGTPYTLDKLEDDYKMGIAIANIHSDKAIPLVRHPVTTVPRPVLSLMALIKAFFVQFSVWAFRWSMHERIEEGCIGMLFPNQEMLYFGNPGGPMVVVTVKNYLFVVFALVYSEWGWTEAIFKGWAATNNTTLLTLFLCQNLAQEKNIFQKFASYFRPSPRKSFDFYNNHEDFFGSVLDGTKTSSVALFENEDEPLEDAQLRKLDRIVDCLTKVDKDSHVLEIGAGWGSFAVRLVQRKGCKVTCVTNSPIEPIQKLAKRSKINTIEALELDFLEIPEKFRDKKFDAIVCIEAIEKNRGRKYDKYFEILGWYCKAGGQVVLQLNCGSYNYDRNASHLVKSYAFSGGSLPTLGDICQYGAKYGLITCSCHRMSINSAYMARKWLKNFLERSSRPDCRFSEEFKRAVYSYLQIVPALTVCNQTDLYQITMEKVVVDQSLML